MGTKKYKILPLEQQAERWFRNLKMPWTPAHALASVLTNSVRGERWAATATRNSWETLRQGLEAGEKK